MLELHGAAADSATLDDAMITGTNGRFEIPNAGTGFTFACTLSD
jgi:hypothetical protein